MDYTHTIDSTTIVLATLNAKYIHASLGLRYLLANMGELRAQTMLREFTIARPAGEIADSLLSSLGDTGIIGFGVYIWNVRQTTEVVRRIKAAQPEITIILGGPEVSHECAEQEIVRLADYVISGWGDLSFADLCRALLAGRAPADKIIAGEQPPLARIAFPYAEYSADDLAHRLLYVEASRGCPFKCEFCLSALDKTAWSFDIDAFLAQLCDLYERGARNFKFVDRTFNLRIETSVRILQFFLDRLAEERPSNEGSTLFAHFEVIPDHLPDRLKAMIAQFPPGALQLEVGVQTFNPAVQQRISRRQDNERTAANLRWLVENSNAHVHADLIFGLPGETLESFADGFDRLYALRPHEIQLGLLKRLRGTPIARHTLDWDMEYEPEPPYTVRRTGAIDAATVQRFARLARYWDRIANSGRFRQTLDLWLGEAASPFQAFLGFSDGLWESTQETAGLSPEALVDALFAYLHAIRGLPARTVREALLADYLRSGARSNPRSLQGMLPRRTAPVETARTLARRQERHLAETREAQAE
jgi:radical SAM superfamily enzyme YgiQ (UPF0313 family)